MAKKLVVNEGCVGCMACISGLSDAEKEIVEKFMKLGEDGLMHGTGATTEDPAEIELLKKVSESCPMGVIEVIDN